MKRIAVAGSEDFVLGFKLAGIRDTFELKDKPLETLKGFMNTNLGIVVVDEDFLNKLESEERVRLEDSVKPVYIPLSVRESRESLRRLIIKSIGIDLWKD